ncbi:Ba25 [Baboon cytomegalovirus]|nr:Ba25 [Baboon cytomegalovirus]
MVLITRQWKHISYACLTFVLLRTVYNAGVSHVTCNNTKTYIGQVGGTVTLVTWPLKGNGFLYWYYYPCGSTQRLCDYSGYDGTTNKASTTKVKFTCTGNGSLLILLDVNTSYSGQYCSWSSSSSSSGNSRYNCHNVTVQLPPTAPPLRKPPKGTENSYTTTTFNVQLQIPSNAPYTGNNGTHNPQAQRQNATHIAGVVIVLVVIILIIILFFLKVPQKFWNKYKVTKSTAPL